jgi:predicted glycosyltransferase involved in capsule biosynthesis
MVFLDVDIIVNCEYLLETINDAANNNMLECLIGYNRTAIYLNELGEKEFLKSLDISDLNSKIEEMQLRTGNHNKYGMVGNTQAVGGCLVMTKDSFKRINGFNPFFAGWGYEDNEVISRAGILGVPVSKSGINNHFLYHLPHNDITQDKGNHPHYKQNEAIAQFVESLNKEQLQRYIKQW